MDVSKGVSTPGTREEATAVSAPAVFIGTAKPEQASASAVCIGTAKPEQVVTVEALEKDITDMDDADSTLLEGSEATTFRSMAARAIFLALDRADIQFAVKEIARRMARPRWGDWALLKRFARYLVTAPRCVTHFAWQHPQPIVDVLVDADWAGCKETSRSTSGGAVTVGWRTNPPCFEQR